jgi:hypothetical protein
MNSATIFQKLWNYCNMLRDDGMSRRAVPKANPAMRSTEGTEAG